MPPVRYLYGDSEPFPLSYDFLDTFRRFLTYAAPSAGRLTEIQELEEVISRRGVALAGELEALDSFADKAIGSLGIALTATGDNELVENYGARLVTFAREHAEEVKASYEAQLRANNSDAAASIAAHRKQIRADMERFLLESEVGGELASVQIQLSGKEYSIRETLRLPGEILITYKINTDRFEAWREPRKLSSVAADIDQLQVGLKKKFLRADLTREMMKVGDHYIVGARVREDGAHIELHKRLDSKGSPLSLFLGVTDNEELEARIERPGSDSAAPFPAVPADVEKIVALWETLVGVGKQALKHRKGVLSVAVDDTEVFREEPEKLLDRLVEIYVPVIREIAFRSPNQNELSLKVEHPDGKREEHYLRKTELGELLAPLDPAARERFAAIPLD